MDSQASAHDLRNMFSVAAKLRLLADETSCEGDQELYREAADALEKRAAWLSGTLPDISYDPPPDQTPELHKPVDLVI